MQGVFSNRGEGFNSSTLIVNHDGIVLLGLGIIGVMGEGKYNKETKTFTIEFLDESVSTNILVSFLFEKAKRTYSFVGAKKSDKTSILVHISDEIPEEIKKSFEK